jgi:hypothetical protein
MNCCVVYPLFGADTKADPAQCIFQFVAGMVKQGLAPQRIEEYVQDCL